MPIPDSRRFPLPHERAVPSAWRHGLARTVAGSLLVASIVSGATHASPTLVADINTVGDPTAGLVSTGIYDLGGMLVFAADDGLYGPEMWISDGSLAGTQRLSAVQDRSSSLGGYVESGGELFFHARDPEFGCQMFTSDLTPGDAERLTTLSSTICPAEVTATSTWVYFRTTTDDEGTEFRRVDSLGLDATEFEMVAGPDGGTVSEAIGVGSDLYFVGDDGVTGDELWRITDSGTIERIDTIDDGGSRSSTEDFTSVSDLFAIGTSVILFAASDGSTGRELFRFNLGSTTTEQVDDINPSGSSDPAGFYRRASGGEVYFAADDGTFGREVWTVEGGGTTTRISDINASGDADPDHFASFGGDVLFFADDGTDVDLWKTDGTLGGTTKVYDFTGLSAGDVKEAVGGTTQIWFAVEKPDEPSELWRSYGPSLGTELLLTFDNLLQPMAVLGGDLFFAASTAADGMELWTSDGTVGGTVMVTDHAEIGSDPNDLVPLGEDLYFSAYEPATGRELWSSDGTAGGTALRFDGDLAGDGFSSFYPGVVFDGFIYYAYETLAEGDEIFRINATVNELAVDVVPGPEDSEAGDFYTSPTHLYFGAYNEGEYYKLYSFDGTTLEVLSAEPEDDDDPHAIFYYDGWTYLNVLPDRELWRTDGTLAGTGEFLDLNSTGRSAPDEFFEGIGLMFFEADEGDGKEPWVSDGTVGGTLPLGDLNPGSSGSNPEDWAASDGHVYFRARNANNVTALWVTDGTPGGTTELLEDVQSDLVPVPGGVLFEFDGEATGREPYVATPTSALPLKDIFPGVIGSNPGLFTAFDGIAYFTANDGETGVELWRSDGTEAGTQRVADILPGPEGSAPDELTVAGDVLWFVANDGVTGRELHRFKVGIFTDGFESGDTTAWQ